MSPFVGLGKSRVAAGRAVAVAVYAPGSVLDFQHGCSVLAGIFLTGGVINSGYFGLVNIILYKTEIVECISFGTLDEIPEEYLGMAAIDNVGAIVVVTLGALVDYHIGTVGAAAV